MDKLRTGLTLNAKLTQKEMLSQELARSVIESVEAHWEEKIRSGIVPTEVLLKGTFNKIQHQEEMEKRAEFEFKIAELLFSCDWKLSPVSEEKEVHYFGVGTGDAFAKIVPLANGAGYGITAYETCSVAYQNALTILERQRTTRKNFVFMADMHYACQSRYMEEDKARVLIASRVLDVLTTQEIGWREKPIIEQKTPRTAVRIGAMLSYLDVLLIHPCANDNKDAIWGDTTPYTLDEIKRYMEIGHGKEIKLSRLGTMSFYGHVYTAALIRRLL